MMSRGIQIFGNNGVLLDTNAENLHYMGDMTFFKATKTPKVTSGGGRLYTGQNNHSNSVVVYRYQGINSAKDVYPFYVPDVGETFTIHTITVESNVLEVILVTSKDVAVSTYNRMLLFTTIENVRNVASLTISTGLIHGAAVYKENGVLKFDSRLEPLKLVMDDTTTNSYPQCVANYNNDNFTANTASAGVTTGTATGLFSLTNGYGTKVVNKTWNVKFTCWRKKVFGVTIASKKQVDSYASRNHTYYKLGLQYRTDNLRFKFLNYVDTAAQIRKSSSCSWDVAGWLGSIGATLDDTMRVLFTSKIYNTVTNALGINFTSLMDKIYPQASYQPTKNATSNTSVSTVVLGIRAQDYVNFSSDVLLGNSVNLVTIGDSTFNIQTDGDSEILLPTEFTSAATIEELDNSGVGTYLTIEAATGGGYKLRYLIDQLSIEFEEFVARGSAIIRLVEGDNIGFIYIYPPATLDAPDELSINGVAASTFCSTTEFQLSQVPDYALFSIANEASKHVFSFTSLYTNPADISIVAATTLPTTMDYVVEQVEGVPYKFRVTVVFEEFSTEGSTSLNRLLTLKIKDNYYTLFDSTPIATTLDVNNVGSVTSVTKQLRLDNKIRLDRGLFQHRAFPKKFLFHGVYADSVTIYDEVTRDVITPTTSLQNLSNIIDVIDNTAPVIVEFKFADVVDSVNYGPNGAIYGASSVLTTHSMLMDLQEEILVEDDSSNTYSIPDELVYSTALTKVSDIPLYNEDSGVASIGDIAIESIYTKNKIISGVINGNEPIDMYSGIGQVIQINMIDGTQRYYHYDGTDPQLSLSVSDVTSKQYPSITDAKNNPVLTLQVYGTRHSASNDLLLEIDDKRINDILSYVNVVEQTFDVSSDNTGQISSVVISSTFNDYSKPVVHTVTYSSYTNIQSSYHIIFKVDTGAGFEYCTVFVSVIASHTGGLGIYKFPVNFLNDFAFSGAGSAHTAIGGTVIPHIFGLSQGAYDKVHFYYNNKFIGETVANSQGWYSYYPDVPAKLGEYTQYSVVFFSRNGVHLSTTPFGYQADECNKILLNIYTTATITINQGAYEYTFYPDGSARIRFLLTLPYSASVGARTQNSTAAVVTTTVENDGAGGTLCTINIPNDTSIELFYSQVLVSGNPVFTECVSAFKHIIQK